MTGIIIQARMSSTRLPGKVMLPLAGKEVLWHVVKRCMHCREAGIVIVATSTEKKDDAIESYCQKNRFDVFRGDLNDVLSRYYDAATYFKLDTIVRVTSDCPLIDPFIIDESVKLFRSAKTPPTPPYQGGDKSKHPLLTKEGRGEVDYVSNCLKRTFPRGLDCEVFSYAMLHQAAANAAGNLEREHVTPWIVQHGATLPYSVPQEYEGEFRLTIDEECDYQLLQKIYNHFYREDEIIEVKNVIVYLRTHPELIRLNQEVLQKHSIN